MRNYKLYLRDILESINRIEKSLKGVTKEAFEKDLDIQDAILRRLEIIGEAVSNIPNEIKNKHPSVEWKKIMGFRIIVSHVYFKINFNIIWDIVENKLFNLKKDIQEILKKENK